ncbi:retropepsin-like domain-containing protein [Candidatus Woesearchaeota archaeon]|nr:retropepsin-like domain-containing protein [Candidatus Woesearchaeota archaeon]
MISFDYKEIKEKSYPATPVTLLSQDNRIEIYAIIDSGSEVSLFDKELAKRLGINYRLTKEIRDMTGVSGRLLVYVHQLNISIGGRTVPRKIGVSDERTTSHNLLSRQGFFENFKITFDETNHKIFLE